MLDISAHAINGIDQRRAQWIADALNARLNDQDQATANTKL